MAYGGASLPVTLVVHARRRLDAIVGDDVTTLLNVLLLPPLPRIDTSELFWGEWPEY